jgi:hypothetical protein
MRLKEVTISGFRGFRNTQTLRLDKNAILIKGLNGSGKSSFVEALEWFFFDEISRRKKSLCRSEYVGDFLRNLHCDKTQETSVEVLAEIGEREVRLRKKLLSPEKKEYFIDDSPVEDFSSLGISFAEVHKPILSQVEIKHYVETDPKDRWEETSKILGLGTLSEFRTALQELLNSKKGENRYESSQKVFYGFESELEDFPELQALSVIMTRRPFSKQAFEEELVKNITETYSLKAKPTDEFGQSLDKEVLKLAQRDKNFETIQALIVPDHTIANYPSRLIEDLRQLFDSLKGLRIVKAELYRFLEMGKELIIDSTCPFCLEETLTDEKRRLIDERMKETKGAMELSSDINVKLAKIRQSKDEMIQKFAFFPNIFTMEKIKERISKDPEYTNETERIDVISKQIASSNETFARLTKELDDFINEVELTTQGKTKFHEAKFESKFGVFQKHVAGMEHILTQLRDDVQSLLGTLVSKTPGLSAREKAELNKALLFRRIIDHLDDIKYVGIFENNMDQVSGLIEEVEKFEKSKSEKLLTNLTKQIKGFYARLNPHEEIQFSEIVPAKGKSRRIRIKAVSYGKNMNPVSCFSESHMNCLCLSVYFSQRVLNNPYWKFVMLDDPVQSMDEDHAKNLIRILAELTKQKQVIVLSHNNKFCQDFRDLFYGTDYLFYEFSGYSENGPKIDLKQASFDTYTAIARKYHNGNMEERAIAANNLRKAIERYTLDMLIHKGKMGHGRASDLKLDERLDKIETAKLLTLDEIGEVKAVLNVCDAGSHEPPRREVTPKELLDGIVAMENLASKYLKTSTTHAKA